jgi:hypothetical protein
MRKSLRFKLKRIKLHIVILTRLKVKGIKANIWMVLKKMTVGVRVVHHIKTKVKSKSIRI